MLVIGISCDYCDNAITYDLTPETDQGEAIAECMALAQKEGYVVINNKLMCRTCRDSKILKAMAVLGSLPGMPHMKELRRR